MKRALERLYAERFHAYLAGAVAIVGDVELGRDAVHEAFARALQAGSRFRGDAPLEAWVWRIVINAARDSARKERRTVLFDDLAELAGVGLPEEHACQLVDELRSLPPQQRLATFLHYYADLPYDEIARLLDVRPGTVAASLNAARANLKRTIEEA